VIITLIAQSTTRWDIRVKVPETTPEGESVYIAGNFNGWDPANSEYRLSKTDNDLWHISLTVPPGKKEFKFTLGSWGRVEVAENGDDIDNREVLPEGIDLISTYDVKAWAEPGRVSNITGDVRVIDDFIMPQLDRTRRIWIYLPPGYEQSRKRYPVLYMHDGQNLFADSTSFSGEWGVDETLERMIADGSVPPMIVVGIENSQYRLSEYSPFDFEYKGMHKGLASAYVRFIVETLKPYIDEHFRTKPGRKFTAIAGSSMGGLVSVYAAVTYQNVFSKVGALSSSFGVCRDDLVDYILAHPKKYIIRFWLDLGSEESEEMEYDVNQRPVIDALLAAGWKDNREVKFTLYEGARHHERYWRNRFSDVLLYLYK
jgi:pullulanase